MNLLIIKTLLINTIQKEMRNKTLLFLFVISLILIILINQISVYFSVNAAPESPLTQFASTKMSILYEIISWWGGLLGLILGVGTLKSDMEYGVSQQIIALPIRPIDYLMSRLVGTWLIVNIYYILILIIALAIFSFSDKQILINYKIFLSLSVFSLKILICITLAALLSIHLSKVMAFVSSIIMLLVVSVSNSHCAGKTTFNFSEIGPFSALGILVHWIFPRVNIISDFSKDLLLDKNTWDFGLIEGTHFIISYLLLFFVTFWSLKNKDFQSVE